MEATIPMNGIIILTRDVMRGRVMKANEADLRTINGTNTWKILRIDESRATDDRIRATDDRSRATDERSRATDERSRPSDDRRNQQLEDRLVELENMNK
jgi:hypothetical protein